MNVANEYERNVTLLTARQVIDENPSLTRAMLWRWARDGKVPHVRLPSGHLRFRREDIDHLLTPVVTEADEPHPDQLSLLDDDAVGEREAC